mgnify:FL=1
MNSSFPERRTASLTRLFVFLGIHFLTIALFPNALFREYPWALYALLWASVFGTASANRFLHALIVQIAGLALFLVVFTLQWKFPVVDIPLFFAFHSGTFVSVSFLSYMRAERDALRSEIEDSQKLLQNLQGDKLSEIQRMLAVNRPAYFDELTILFSDIRNFTGLSEVLPADKLYAVLNAYYSGVVKIVREHGGIIDKFLGDGIMVVFGLGRANDSAPDMAVRCAIRLREYQLNGFNAELPGDYSFSAGIGIATGRVMVGLVGSSDRFEWTCLGDPVNLAARLENMTRRIPSAILISEATWMHIRDNQDIFTRIAGYFKVRGRFSEEAVVEVFNGDSPELSEAKKRYRQKFEAALNMQKMGYTESSSNVFREIASLCPGDQIAELYARSEKTP